MNVHDRRLIEGYLPIREISAEVAWEKSIRRRHFSRNPQIVGVLKAWHYIEELGFGVDRVFREMEAAGAPPPLITDDGGVVTVTLYAFKPISPTNAALRVS